MSTELNRGEYHIEGVDEASGCNALVILSTTCHVCRNPVSGMFIALGMPYYCVVHATCMQFFPFDGRWVHPAAFNVMASRSASATSTLRHNSSN